MVSVGDSLARLKGPATRLLATVVSDSNKLKPSLRWVIKPKLSLVGRVVVVLVTWVSYYWNSLPTQGINMEGK
jgi:hypothetical protein